MQEKHEFGLVVASSKFDAQNIAKSKWLMDCDIKHNDDITNLQMIISFDDCHPIKNIGNLEI
tara:strand:+ start:335 stop:520 length:186 start_codon:yes stop_codon:yes gene_type:complete